MGQKKLNLEYQYISVAELRKAETAFLQELKRFSGTGESKSVIMSCALGAVWKAAKLYERNKQQEREAAMI